MHGQKIYTIDEIKALLNPIFKANDVIKSILFGSYARGEATAESDVDLITYVKDSMSIFKFAEMSGDVEDILDKKIDFLYGGDEFSKSMQESIEKTGVLLFEKV